MFKARALVWTCVLLGFVAGVVLSLASPSWAARNSSGTYSLPTGNPVVTGTSITSTWANTTLADIKTEITSSLDRAGRGAMTAPLQFSAGTVSLPSATFSSDTNSGLYSVTGDSVGMSAGGTKIQGWTTTGATFPIVATFSAGEVITQSTANGNGLNATGNGSGIGGVFVGGSTSGTGIYVSGGAPNGVGISAEGLGSGVGGTFTGGATGSGGSFIAGGGNTSGLTGAGSGSGVGGAFTGGTTGAGLSAANGTAATGGTRRDAITLTNGDIDLSGVANPTSTTAISERLTPMNLPKVWARISVVGGSPSVVSGFNVTSVSCAASSVTLTIGADMATTSNAVLVTASSQGRIYAADCGAVGTANVRAMDHAGSVVDLCNAATNDDIYVLIFGAQ